MYTRSMETNTKIHELRKLVTELHANATGHANIYIDGANGALGRGEVETGRQCTQMAIHHTAQMLAYSRVLDLINEL